MDKSTFHNHCKTKKLRPTPQRWHVYDTLTHMSDHPSVEAVYKKAIETQPSLTLNTVYKSLEWMEKNGFVMSVPIRESKKKYCPNPAPHHHMVCTVCGSIKDFDKTDITDPVPDSLKNNFNVVGFNLIVSIICDRCLDAGKSRKATDLSDHHFSEVTNEEGVKN